MIDRNQYPALHSIVHRYGLPKGVSEDQQEQARGELELISDEMDKLQKENEACQAKLVQHGFVCDGVHMAPPCRDVECWHRTATSDIPKECGCKKSGNRIVQFNPECTIHGNPGTPCSQCQIPTRGEDGGKSVWNKTSEQWVWLCPDCQFRL